MTGDADADALLEDYKLKVAFATEHAKAVQTQFQVMLTLESALATALIVSNTGSLTKGAPWIAALEAALSAAWAFVGWAGQKRWSDLYHDLAAAGRGWSCAAGLQQPYSPVGSGQTFTKIAWIAPRNPVGRLGSGPRLAHRVHVTLRHAQSKHRDHLMAPRRISNQLDPGGPISRTATAHPAAVGPRAEVQPRRDERCPARLVRCSVAVRVAVVAHVDARRPRSCSM